MKFDPDAKILIAMALGGSKNIRMHAEEMSFREFGEFCSKPQKGGKHEAYFTRGVPRIEEKYTSRSGQSYYDGRFRHDSSIDVADFLVIDADNSELTPLECHLSLLNHGNLSHFIYTSHSHSSESNNYRVVIPCQMKNKAELKATAHKIIDDINLLGGGKLEFVKEMGTWSQSWYLPTRDDPSDGVFEYYEYMEGEEYESIESRTEKVRESERLAGESVAMDKHSMDNPADSRDSQTIAELTEIVRTYSEGCHHAMLKLSWGFKEDGMPESTAVIILQGIMNEFKDRDERTAERYSDIKRTVAGAYSNAEIIKFGSIDGGQREGAGVIAKESTSISSNGGQNDDKQLNDIPWPPGMMGELATSVYNFSLYPNKTISVVTALGLIAGIAGRRFNISGGGLNLYMTLLMETGGGKSVISKYINRVLNDSALFTGANNFTGSSRYTGPKALMDDLLTKRCFVSVFTEAGFMFRSKSGDQDGLTRAILDLYGSSGAGSISVGSSYSSDKNSIKSVAAPCFSMVNESTPDIFLQALKDGAKTGEINRMNIFRVNEGENGHIMNRDARFDVPEHIVDKIGDLMGRCNNTQQKDDPDVTVFQLTEDMYLFADEIKRQAIRTREDDYVKSSMMQRSAEKTFKLAALCTVLNNRGEKGERIMQIDKAAWEWALNMHNHEMAGLNEFFRVDSSDDIFRTIAENLYPFIAKIFNNKYKDKKKSISTDDRKKNRMPVYVLRQASKSNKAISALGTAKYGKSGLDIALKYLVDQGFCKLKQIGSKKINYVIFNENILELEEYI